MKTTEVYFKLYDKHGLRGYHIPVRNTLSKRLEQEFIPESAKEVYKRSFGDRIISDAEFIEWYAANALQFNSV